jgi:hypothetical protein
MVKVIGVKVRAHGKEYKPGDTISNLSPADEKSLIDDGYAEKVDGTGDKLSGKEKDNTPTAEELIKLIEASNVKEDVEKILAEELANKHRKTVLAAAATKLEVLTGNDDDDQSGKGGSEDPSKLVGGFNASDVIVPGEQQ